MNRSFSTAQRIEYGHFVAARLVLAELYAQQGQNQKAKEQYKTVIEMKPFRTDLAEIEKKLEGLK